MAKKQYFYVLADPYYQDGTGCWVRNVRLFVRDKPFETTELAVEYEEYREFFDQKKRYAHQKQLEYDDWLVLKQGFQAIAEVDYDVDVL